MVIGSGGGAAQNDVDNGIDIGDVNFMVLIHIGSCGGAMAVKDDIDDCIDIGDVDLMVVIDIAR